MARVIIDLRDMNGGLIAYVAAGQIAAIEPTLRGYKISLTNGLSFDDVERPDIDGLLTLMSETTMKTNEQLKKENNND